MGRVLTHYRAAVETDPWDASCDRCGATESFDLPVGVGYAAAERVMRRAGWRVVQENRTSRSGGAITPDAVVPDGDLCPRCNVDAPRGRS